MEHAFAEMPLVLFTTLAPAGAGAFIALALAFLTTTFSDEVLKKIDKFTWVPFVLVILGFGASFMHLASPFNAVNAFTGLGASPLSNEILVGCIFVVIALIYLIIATAGKLSEGLRKGLSCIVAIAAVVFAFFTGIAYAVDTIPSWNSAFVPVSMIGFALAGGSILSTWVIGMGGGLAEAKKTSAKNGLLALTIIGVLLALVAVIAHFGEVSGMSNAAVEGSALTQDAMPFLIVFAIAAVLAAVCEFIALGKKDSVALASVGALLILVAILCARLLFYALQISVGV